jgi:hypothetical protein
VHDWTEGSKKLIITIIKTVCFNNYCCKAIGRYTKINKNKHIGRNALFMFKHRRNIKCNIGTLDNTGNR